MKTRLRYFTVFFSIALGFIFIGCEKEITVDLPATEPKIVVEGSIEQGQPPIILLTYSQGYFEPTDLSSLSSFFVHDAEVTLSNGTLTESLIEICTSDLTPEQLELVSGIIGFTPEELAQYQICVYTTLNPDLWGEEGKVYDLTVVKDQHSLHSSTKINQIVALDSLWFKIPNEDPGDSLGFIFSILTDPDTSGNAYRWYAKRINHYPAWAPQGLAGQQKDDNFIAPLGSVSDDAFFNGLQFEFGYIRGTGPNPSKFDDLNEERGFFKRGDTIVVKGCSIDLKAYQFILSYESQIANQGSPFSIPYNLQSNVEGGLGAFIGYAAYYDTLICQ
ncbi:MAG: DUF4249 family protein [Flavobacteriales bacterium]